MTPPPAPSRLHTRAQWGGYRRTPLTGRLSPATWRAAWWAARSVRSARTALRADGVRAVVAAPPALPAGARRGVDAVLRRLEPTCLERCLVLQAWLAAHRVPCEVVVGIAAGAAGAAGVRAHAWLDVEAHDAVARRYREIHRLSPP